MKTDSLKVSIAGLELPNPTAQASGILGYTAEMLKIIAENGAGAVVTKSVGLRPRIGYVNPTIVQTNCGLLNAMGLPNPGISEFAQEISKARSLLKIPLIVSVYGFSAREYAVLCTKAFDAGADAVELNVSCPHVKETGSEIGQDPRLLSKVVEKAKGASSKPLFVKLSPNVTSMTELGTIAVRSGADALVVMNTVKAMAIDVETKLPILANRVGGLSGPSVKPIAVRHVYDLYEKVKVPIIGCGGVASWKDAVEFMLAGAAAVQIGTAIATRGLTVFRQVSRGIGAYLKRKQFRSVTEIVGLSHRR